MAREAKFTENKSILLEKDMEVEVKEISERDGVSEGAAYRHLLRRGLVAFHRAQGKVSRED